ncbi:MAG: metal ABC transporter permease [Candidatus Handelsmanbacteria bacterium]|nr:metal ABC transporter permease [Candidatus Handelsmanbacteria bacterium]
MSRGGLAAFHGRPFAACLVLVGIYAYLGRTRAFLAGYELDSVEAYLISLAAAFIGVAVFSLTRLRQQQIIQEAVIGITYAVAAAAGVLAIDQAPHGAEHLRDLLVGSILWVTWPQVLKIAGL